MRMMIWLELQEAALIMDKFRHNSTITATLNELDASSERVCVDVQGDTEEFVAFLLASFTVTNPHDWDLIDESP